LTRWRKHLGEAGVEELLEATIDAAERAGVIKASSVKREVIAKVIYLKHNFGRLRLIPSEATASEVGFAIYLP